MNDDELVTELKKLRERRGMRPGVAAVKAPKLGSALGVEPSQLHREHASLYGRRPQYTGAD